MINLKISNLKDVVAPLYHRYPRQNNPQPAYVQLCQDGSVYADFSADIGGGQSFDVFHGRTLNWPVSPFISGLALAGYLEGEGLELLQRIHNGHGERWDGNNYVGTITDDASAASDDLRLALEGLGEDESCCDCVWDVATWLGQLCFQDKWEEGKTLAEAVKPIEDQADLEGIYLDGNVEKYLLDCAERQNAEHDCYRPEILVALLDDGRHPLGPTGEELKA